MEEGKKRTARKRSPMRSSPEQMRILAEALRAEVEQWPDVTVKRSFGMMLAYRGKTVFAALPHTKAIYREDAIMLKFVEERPALVKRLESDPHFISAAQATGRSAKSEGRKWHFFLVRNAADVHAALEWLAEAFKLARGRKTAR